MDNTFAVYVINNMYEMYYDIIKETQKDYYFLATIFDYNYCAIIIIEIVLIVLSTHKCGNNRIRDSPLIGHNIYK